jgi:hypothetical protein
MKTVIRITQKKNPDFYPGQIIRIETEIRIEFTIDWQQFGPEFIAP